MTSPPIPIPTSIPLPATPTPSAPPDPSGGIGWWNGAEGAFTHWVQQGGAWLMPQLQSALGNGGTTPDADWFTPIYEVMLGLGFAFAIPLAIVGLIVGLVRGDGLAMVGQLARNLFAAVLLAEVAVWLVVLLDHLADDVTTWALKQLVGNDLTGFITHMSTTFAGAAAGTLLSGAPEVVGILLGGVILLGSVVLMVELLMRMVGIYLGLAFVPLAAVGLLNPSTHGWIHRLAQIEIGLIVLKPAIAILLGIGAAMLTASPLSIGPQGDPGLVAFLGGLVVIGLTVFTPAYLMKFVPWAEASFSSVVSQKAQSVAGVPFREGSRRVGEATMQRFGSRIPGLAPKAATAGAGAAATAGGTVVLNAASVVVRRAGDVPALTGAGKGPSAPTPTGTGKRAPTSAGPPASKVRVRSGAESSTAPEPSKPPVVAR